MLLAGSLLGEWPILCTRPVSLRLRRGVLLPGRFRRLVGFTTYAWLLHVASPTAVSTYAYVNPLIAVLLGFLLAGEALDAGVLLPAGLIVAAVVLITLPRTLFRSSAGGEASTEPPRPWPGRRITGRSCRSTTAQ